MLKFSTFHADYYVCNTCLNNYEDNSQLNSYKVRPISKDSYNTVISTFRVE